MRFSLCHFYCDIFGVASIILVNRADNLLDSSNQVIMRMTKELQFEPPRETAIQRELSSKKLIFFKLKWDTHLQDCLVVFHPNIQHFPCTSED